jgi:hypothetical protein
MEFQEPVSLLTALRAVIGTGSSQRFNTIDDIARQFAKEPGAPTRGDWRYVERSERGGTKANPQRSYVARRLAESGEVGIREAQRWLALAGSSAKQTRGIPPHRMELLRQAAQKSAGGISLSDLARNGAKVRMRGVLRISDTEEFRTPPEVKLHPNHMAAFQSLWESKQYAAAEDAFNAAFGEGYGPNPGGIRQYTQDTSWGDIEEFTIR